MIRKLLFVFSILLLCACSATGPKYSEYHSTVSPVEEGKARLYFYRNSRFMSAGVDAVISVNGSNVGECANGAYFYTDTVSGPATISVVAKAAPGEHQIERELEAGNEYYFEVLVNEAYVHSGAFAGLIGQGIYLANNENSCGWIFNERASEDAVVELADKTFSLDGE